MIIKALIYEQNLINIIAKSVIFIGDDGQTGILENHAPIILFSKKGYLKITPLEQDDIYIYFERGIFTFSNNTGVLLASVGEKASSMEEAFNIFSTHRSQIKQASYSDDIDYTKLERELVENIKKGSPSKI